MKGDITSNIFIHISKLNNTMSKKFEAVLYEDQELAHPKSTITLEEIKGVWFINGDKVEILPLEKLGDEAKIYYNYWIEQKESKDFALLYANINDKFNNIALIRDDRILFAIIDDMFIRMYRGMKFLDKINYVDGTLHFNKYAVEIRGDVSATIEEILEVQSGGIPPLS